MLVISRREGEFLRIGDNVDVVISKLKGGRVVIGIEAPKETIVLRGELCGQGDDGKGEAGRVSDQ